MKELTQAFKQQARMRGVRRERLGGGVCGHADANVLIQLMMVVLCAADGGVGACRGGCVAGWERGVLATWERWARDVGHEMLRLVGMQNREKCLNYEVMCHLCVCASV